MSSINIKYKFTPTFASTFQRLRQFTYVSFYEFSSIRQVARSSVILDDPRVPCEHLLAVTSGRIAVVRTKVFKSSSLSIIRSNRLAPHEIKIGY